MLIKNIKALDLIGDKLRAFTPGLANITHQPVFGYTNHSSVLYAIVYSYELQVLFNCLIFPGVLPLPVPVDSHGFTQVL